MTTQLTFYTLEIGRRRSTVRSLAAASESYCALRDKLGFGSSKMPDGIVWHGDVAIARVSYNGRVWPISNWTADSKPIYDNRGVA